MQLILFLQNMSEVAIGVLKLQTKFEILGFFVDPFP